MPRRVIAYHVILTCYGFWLPNDPRGSNSQRVWANALKPFGPATFTTSRRSVARRPHDFELRRRAKEALKYTPVVLDGIQARAVARGFATCLAKANIDCYACVVLPEHAHLVVSRGELLCEEIMVDLKSAAVHQLNVDQIHPFAPDARGKRPKTFAEGGRKVYCFNEWDVRRCINYVERNPEFDGLPRQHWSWVKPYP
jgi:hypothetical protein